MQPIDSAPLRVIFALGTTDDTQGALDVAIDLARVVHAQLHVVHVLPHADPLDSAETDAMLLGKLGALRLEHAKDAAERRLLRDVEPHLRFGDLAHEVAEVVREVGGDFLVLGPVDHTSFQRALFGAEADRLLRDAPCHVVIAHVC